MFRLSIPAREALARLVLPILVLLSLALLLLGRAEPGLWVFDRCGWQVIAGV